MQGPGKSDAFVADASVLVKWFNDEEYRERALLLREAHVKGRLKGAAPSLAPYEICNALRYGGASGDDVRSAYRDLRGFEIHFVEPNEDVMSAIVTTSFECNLTIYDASYVALAEVLGVPLVTVDSKMMKNAPLGVRVMDLVSDEFLDFVSPPSSED